MSFFSVFVDAQNDEVVLVHSKKTKTGPVAGSP